MRICGYQAFSNTKYLNGFEHTQKRTKRNEMETAYFRILDSKSKVKQKVD